MSKNSKYFLVVISVLFQFILFGQNRKIDSLKLLVQNAKHDTTRCELYVKIGNRFYSENPDSAINYWQKAQLLAETNLPNSAAIKLSYLKILSNALSNIGLIYQAQGDIPKALEYGHKSLKIQEEIGDKGAIAGSLNIIGHVFKGQGEVSKALEYFQKSLKIIEEIGDKQGITGSLNSIGGIYMTQGNMIKALDCFQKTLKILEELGDKKGISILLNNIGMIYFEHGDPSVTSSKEDALRAGIPIALEYYQKSLKIKEEIGDKNGIANTLNNIGTVYIKQGKLSDGYTYVNKSMQLAKELGYPENILNSASLLKSIFQKQNKYKEAFEMYELEIKMRDSIVNQETQKAAIKKQMQYTYEKQEEVAKAEHKKELEKQQAVAEEKNRRQNIIIGSVVLGLLLVIIFAGYVFKTLSVTKKQKALIELKNKETEHQKREIEEKQKEILDSIHYAKRIQMAQVPSEKRVANLLNRLKK